MKISKGTVVVKLGKPLYGAQSLAAGALTLGVRAQVFVAESKTAFSVEIKPTQRLKDEQLRALGGEFLNATLNHEYRQRVVCANAPLTSAVFAPLFLKGFPALPADPLEELEPQVKIDRLRDVEELLAQARGMK
jgi:hypothetical protein